MRKSLIGTLMLLVVVATAAIAQEAAPEGVVNVNTAEAEQLALLPGIGIKTAERIVAWRSENGEFAKLTDLMQVKGIGDATFERIRPYVTLEGKTTLASEVRLPRKAKPSTTAQQ
ncbi:MAG: ComEA family DNA-binding protein [Thermoanaerobaculia bacterium]